MLPTVSAIEGGTVSAVAQATQELKTVDIYFGFSISIAKDTSVSKTLNFTPVDWGAKSWVKVSLIRIVDEQAGSPTLYMWVNGVACNTPSILATIGRGQYVADFECTNVINRTGIYNVTLKPTGFGLDNAHFRSWVTYTTDLTNQTIASQKQFVEALNYFDATAEEKLKSNHDYCLDNVTMRKVLTTEKCGILYNITTCFTINKTEDNVCNYGCDTQQNQCKEAPYMTALKIFGGVVGFILLLIFILRLSGRI
jgi:hypothetical protein